MNASKTKAGIVAMSFAVAGAAAAFFTVHDLTRSFPLLVFYGVTALNAYFSIRCFASITPENYLQRIIDTALFLLYVALVFTFDSPFSFVAVATLLFAAASMKYASLLTLADMRHVKLIREKILIDNIGAVACFLTLLGIVWGHPLLASYTLAAVFVAANIYFLTVNPFYELDRAARQDKRQ